MANITDDITNDTNLQSAISAMKQKMESHAEDSEIAALNDSVGKLKSAIDKFTAIVPGNNTTYMSVPVPLKSGHKYHLRVLDWDITGAVPSTRAYILNCTYTESGVNTVFFGVLSDGQLESSYIVEIPEGHGNAIFYIGGRVSKGKNGVILFEDLTYDLALNEIGNVQQRLDKAIITSESDVLSNKDFVRKTINFGTGEQAAAVQRISLSNKIRLGDGEVLVKPNGKKVWWYEYNSNDEKINADTQWAKTDFYLKVTNGNYYNFCVAKIDDSVILPEENTVEVIKDIGKPAVISPNKLLLKTNMTSGALQTAVLKVATAINWLSYLSYVPINGNEAVSIILPTLDGVIWHYRYGWYASDKTYIMQIPDTQNNMLIVPSNAAYFSFAFFACDSSGNQLVNYDLETNFPANETIKIVYNYRKTSEIADEKSIVDFVYDNFSQKPTIIPAGYSVGADMIKRDIGAEKLSGLLLYPQSFCMYNGKYYSSNGSRIGVQNSAFVTENDVEVSVGHANTFQVGTSNIAYISGWNDHKIYAINLDTLAVSNIISLPFSDGYEDAVVDDVNQIAYIFHREGISDTDNGYYDFVVYDITNGNIISQKKTTVAFSWMQSCDFYDGKIILIYGGNDESNVKCKILVFSTSGDVIAEVKPDIFTGDEAEGVYIDRNTGDLLVSGYSRIVYKIVQTR